ncbi:MAG: tRNA pseudouridine(55) synthase TruB [Rubripirellula sp.]
MFGFEARQQGLAVQPHQPLTRRKIDLTLFGFICCNKPPGMTSRDVVNVLQRRLRKQAKVGHAGTLDPLAEGVLVLGVGPAVRLVSYVQQTPKHYRSTFRFGQSSITGDLEGELTHFPNHPVPNQEQIDVAVQNLTGRIEQTPPAHSAIWVDGQRAYKRIRAGEDFEMPKRTVDVYSLEVLRYEYPEIDLNMTCGSGTYVRTLGIDLAKATGTEAVMAHLVRHGVGPFQLKDAVSVEQLREDEIEPMLLPAALGVSHLPTLKIDQADSERLGHGVCVNGDPAEAALQCPLSPVDGIEEGRVDVAAVTPHGLRAIVRQKQGAWFPHRVFPDPDFPQ